MKPTELKAEYIRLRAEGNSYSVIAEKLNISKSTCTSWEQDLKEQIDEQKRAELAELAKSYGMAKEARIKSLGDTLDKINKAIEQKDFTELSADKLLELKLKYADTLKGECIGLKPAQQITSVDGQQIVAALGDLLNRVRAGEVSIEQANKESNILSQLLKAYETVEVTARLNELEAIVGGRQ